jgi:hypothetical protein
MGAPAASMDLLHNKTSEKLRMPTPWQAAFDPFLRCPLGGFPYAAMKIALGAPIAGIRTPAKRTTAKLKYLKFMTENKFCLKMNMLYVG